MSILYITPRKEKVIDKFLTEYYYDQGYLPDRYYNQLNSKSAQENYNRQKNKRISINKKKNTSFFEDFIFGMLKSSLNIALNEILDELLPKK